MFARRLVNTASNVGFSVRNGAMNPSATTRAFTSRLYSTTSPVEITFFSKDNCMLCYNAGEILKKAITESESKHNSQIKLTTIDIMKNENVEWYDKYGWDVPVVDIHSGGEVHQFMHYFYKNKLIEAITGESE